MATTPVDITDTGGVNFAAVKNVALAETDYGLVVRAIVSPANASFSALQVPVAAPPTAFKVSNDVPDNNRRFVRVKNGTTYNIFLGDSSVSYTKGYILMPGEAETFELGPNVQIWGLGASGAAGDISVLELG
jgi:hypothetical protein